MNRSFFIAPNLQLDIFLDILTPTGMNYRFFTKKCLQLVLEMLYVTQWQKKCAVMKTYS